MTIIRKLRFLAAVVVTTWLALSSGVAYGLGMSELDLKSHLNQRFDGEIELTGAGNLQLDEIIANLGSQEDFERVGVDRGYHLTDLRFKVRQREDGELIIHVTSSKPIIEPFLNFIVEAIWPTGRILREYTILLDPPMFGTQGIKEIEPGSVSGPSSRPSTSATSSAPRKEGRFLLHRPSAPAELKA